MTTLASMNDVVGGPTLEQRRSLVTEIPGPVSRELLERKAAAVAAGVAHTVPIAAVAAGGGVIVDADGNSLIDLGAGIAVTSVGNAHPKVVEAVQRQAAAFTHTCFMISPYEGYVAVAEALNRLTPGDFPKKSALFNSGAEAVENAIKIARLVTGKHKIIARYRSYHGGTAGAMTLTGDPRRWASEPGIPGVVRAMDPYRYRCRFCGDKPACTLDCLNNVEDVIMFEGAQKLAPGTWLEIGPDGVSRVHRYWDPVSRAAEAGESGRVDRIDAARLGQVMEDSVAAHLVADVPVATFLSGGLDSSLITVMAMRHNTELDSYTISFRDEDQRYEAMPDDFLYARKIAADVSARFHSQRYR